MPNGDEPSRARSVLLARLLEACEGIPPPPSVSMRQLASLMGTTHGLLRYHFSSYEGLLAALLAEQRRRDNVRLAEQCVGMAFREALTEIWQQYGRGDQDERMRAFFYVASRAAYAPAAFGEFLETQPDLERVLAGCAVREGAEVEVAARAAQVAIATMRGLILARLLGESLPDDELVMDAIVAATGAVGVT